MQTGLSPLPGPLALAFAQTIFAAEGLPLVIGLLFHTAWTTSWTVIFVVVFRNNPSFLKALGLGLTLWLVVLMVFFPIVGWGLLGLAQSGSYRRIASATCPVCRSPLGGLQIVVPT